MKRSIFIAGAFLAALCMADTAESDIELRHRWVYVSANMLVEKNVEELLPILERVSKAGYTGIVLTDSKFTRWDTLPKRYHRNVSRVREACRRLELDVNACVMPIGYSNGLLSKDPNLASGLPVKDAPFLVRGGKLVPDDTSVKLLNGGFESSKANRPTGWSHIDLPGKIAFIDTEIAAEGKVSLRFQDIGTHSAKHGHGRANQRMTVQPFRYYHLSASVRTKDFNTNCRVQLTALAKGRTLVYARQSVKPTQDWERLHVTFNTLDNEQIYIYLGVWGGKNGTIWWDDVRLEPAGLVNLVRREGAPFVLKSEDGETTYVEGKDYAGARDPKLGRRRWAGDFSEWHDSPSIAIPPASRLQEGDRVLISYYHTALIHGKQAMCCMSEPKVYEILGWQVERVKQYVQPDGYFMSHDEIRVQGWDESCASRNMTPGQILADNVKRCVEIIRRRDPGKPIYVWSDMFDPTHNAKDKGKYYLVAGEGPWYGSWEGLDKDVIVVNWHLFPRDRLEALKHFAGRGHRQILAGYYDGKVERIRDWLREAAQVEGVVGVMYTTWRRNYKDLEAFSAELDRVASKGGRKKEFP